MSVDGRMDPVRVPGGREEVGGTLTGGEAPSGDVAGVLVGQDLIGGGQVAEQHVGVQHGILGQTQQGNVKTKGRDRERRISRDGHTQ